MRRILIVLSLLWISVLIFSSKAMACNLVLNPSYFTVKSGDTLSFRLERYKTHKVCVTPLEDTKIIVTGGELVDPGKWVEGTPDVLNFTVKFTTPGNSTVRVERYCTKVGLMYVDTAGIVGQASVSGTNTTPAPAAQEKPTAPPGAAEVTKPSTQSIAENAANASFLSTLISKATFDSLSLQLWYLIFAVGLLLFLFKTQQLRKLLLFIGIIILGFYLGGCPEPVGTPFIMLVGNSSMFKIALILFLVPFIISLIWGRVFCGWMCPLGGIQEMAYSDKINIPISPMVDKYGKLLKYVVLAVFLFLTWKTGKNYWGEYEPFKVLFNFEGTTVAIIILVITLAASVVIERPFCRYICPLGAILSISSRIAPFRIRLDDKECKGCKLCSKKTCPVNAITMCDDERKIPVIDNYECIRCLNCIDQCRFKALFVSCRTKTLDQGIEINADSKKQ